MKPHARKTGRSDYTSVSNHACPLCDQYLIRIGRRPIDRLLSQFVPVHRYRCRFFSCQWEGNLDVDSNALTTFVRFLRRPVFAKSTYVFYR